MLLKTMIFIYIGTALSAMQHFNENEFIEKEKTAISHIANFCLGKPKKTFAQRLI
jgi:hypothetical protein